MSDIVQFATAKKNAVERFEFAYLATLMATSRGNLSRAARRAGMTRQHLRTLLRAHGLYGQAGSATPES